MAAQLASDKTPTRRLQEKSPRPAASLSEGTAAAAAAALSSFGQVRDNSQENERENERAFSIINQLTFPWLKRS